MTDTNPDEPSAPHRFDPVEVDLKNRYLAAVLAWLFPGVGHLYQRRYGKGVLFMACILGTYVWGLAMGEGHVVYASWRPSDLRLYYVAQVHVGLPALGAIPQSYLVAKDQPPAFGGWLAPPKPPLSEGEHDHKAMWHEKLGFYFELGTLFTTVAGLLNLLAVYDAFAGPAFGLPQTSSGTPTDEDGQPIGLLESSTNSFGFFGAVGGLIIAMTLRGGVDIDSDILGYLFALIGVGVGWALGRLLRLIILRWHQGNVAPALATNDGAGTGDRTTSSQREPE